MLLPVPKMLNTSASSSFFGCTLASYQRSGISTVASDLYYDVGNATVITTVRRECVNCCVLEKNKTNMKVMYADL